MIFQDLKEEDRGGQASVRFKIIYANLTLSLCFPAMRQDYFEVTNFCDSPFGLSLYSNLYKYISNATLKHIFASKSNK